MNYISNKNKVLYDIVHGYIEIDKNIEQIINDPLFQRLKDIKQQASYHLFPSANHTRFEHSLGVMKLAKDAFYQYANELEEAIVKDKSFRTHLERSMVNPNKPITKDNILRINTSRDREIYKQWLKFHLEYAALLHDIGHAPLSHIGEHFYEKEEIKEAIQKIIDEKSVSEYNKINDETKIDLSTFEKGSPHEWMSCYIILNKFYDYLNKIYDSIKTKDANRFCYNKKTKLEVDFGFIIRIITGNGYNTNDIGNGIIQLVNNKTIDCDRLDYALRDNFMVGDIGAFVDTKRLFNSLTFDRETFDIIFKKGALSSLKNYIDCRDNLYMWVCNHHLIVYTDFLYQESLKQLFKTYPDEYKKEDYFSCNAITNDMPTDNEIHSLLRRHWNKLKNYNRNTEEQYFFNLLEQLFKRNQKLSSLYKTRKGYMDLLTEIKKGNDSEQTVNDKMDKIIINKRFLDNIKYNLNFDEGNFFILKKANKDFMKNDIDSICIVDNEGNKNSLETYISHKEHDEITDITIFIYYKPSYSIEKQKEQKQIKKVISNYIYGIQNK